MCKHRKQNKTKQNKSLEQTPSPPTLDCLVSGLLSFLWQIRVGKQNTTQWDPISTPLPLPFGRSVAQFKFSMCSQSFQVLLLLNSLWFCLSNGPESEHYCRICDKWDGHTTDQSSSDFLSFQRIRVRALERSVQLYYCIRLCSIVSNLGFCILKYYPASEEEMPWLIHTT